MIDFLKKPTIDNETKDMDDEEKEEAKEEEEEENSIKTPIKSTYTLTTSSSKSLREKQATKDENRRLVTIDAVTGIEFFNGIRALSLRVTPTKVEHNILSL